MSKLSPPLRVAIVGAGYFGSFHYDAWRRTPEAEIVGICARRPEAAADLAAEYGAPGQPLPIFPDAAEMAEKLAPLHIVDITAPPVAHLELIRALAPKVDNIICQKPFCDGVEGARAALKIAEETGVRIAVHENIRFQPWYREIKRILDRGDLGELYQISFRLRPGDGQGPRAYMDRQPYFQSMPRFLVHETAIHWVDCFRYLFGEATSVYAELARLNPQIAGEDAGFVLMNFADGRRGLFDGNRLADHIAENRRRTMGEMLIEGAKAALRLDGDARLWLRPHGSNDETEHTFEWRDHLFGGDCVYACNRGILDAWLAGVEPEVSARRYLRNQEIEEAIYVSAEDGRRITMPAVQS